MKTTFAALALLVAIVPAHAAPAPVDDDVPRLVQAAQALREMGVAADAGAVGLDAPVRLARAGDFDGDGLGDVVVAGPTPDGYAVEARRGADAARLWSIAWPGVRLILLLDVGDATGDGVTDFVSARYDEANATDIRWRVGLLSGSDGAFAWEREFPGIDARDPVIGAVGVRENGAILVATHGPLVGVTLQSETWAVVPVPTFRALALRLSDGEATFERQSRGAIYATLLPMGDVDADGHHDLLWQEELGGLYGIFCVLDQECVGHVDFVTEAISGSDGRTLWTRHDRADNSFEAIPAMRDLTGDGAFDILHTRADPRLAERTTMVRSGATGVDAWPAPLVGTPSPLGVDVGGSPGEDLALATFALRSDEAFRFVRVDGATGGTLFETRTKADPRGGGIFGAFSTDDMDGDGARELVSNAISAGYDHHLSIESGATGEVLHAYVGRTSASLIPVGDLDGDGDRDLLHGSGATGGMSLEARATRGGVLWARQVALSPGEGLALYGLGDATGDGKSDVLVAPRGAPTRMGLLHGATGDPAWWTPTG